ncbi:MAG: SsrA-binding protein SmpB [Pseudomonadota bacterium]
MKKKIPTDIKIIAKNKKAFFDYHIEDKFEAGLVLEGSEVKSLRDGKASLSDSFAIIKNAEVWLLHAHIAQYAPASYANHEPKRARKLLMHKAQIIKLTTKLKERGYTLVPTMIYFKKGRAKVELGVAHGKRKYDKRAAIKARESKRELSKAMKRKHT